MFFELDPAIAQQAAITSAIADAGVKVATAATDTEAVALLRKQSLLKKTAAAMTKLGMDMRKALGATPLEHITDGPTITSAGLMINTVALKAGGPAGSQGSWDGMDYVLTGADKTTQMARVYTNQGDPKLVAFDKAGYSIIASDAAANPGSVLLVTDGTPANGIDLMNVMAADFVHQGTQEHPIPNNNVALKVRGTFDGASGEYSCTGTCSSTNDGSGSPSGLGGTWHFRPDAGAMVSRPDAHYLYYGWWVSKDSDGVPTVASAFTGRDGTDAAITDGLDMSDDGDNITGSATYVGHAAGKFAMSNTLNGTGNGGHFTADAKLNAKFGAGVAEAGVVTGTIDGFRLNDGSEDPGWSVSLNNGQFGGTGSINSADLTTTSDVNEGLSTVWSINDNPAPASGTWSGQMYDETPGSAPAGDGSNIPTTVTGTFHSDFSVDGRMVGAFGADKE